MPRQRISIPVTPEQAATLGDLARHSGKTLAAYVRDRLFAEGADQGSLVAVRDTILAALDDLSDQVQRSSVPKAAPQTAKGQSAEHDSRKDVGLGMIAEIMLRLRAKSGNDPMGNRALLADLKRLGFKPFEGG